MQEQLLNSNNLKEKLKELGVLKKAPSNVQEWLNTVAHKHWLKLLPQERFTGSINEDWFQQKSQKTIFKQLIITPQFTSEVNHLIDFLNQNYQIKKDDEIIYKPLNKLNYLECQRQAQSWIDKINNKTSLEEDWDGLKEVKRIEFEGHEYTLYELTSRQNLLREGKVMNNCISTYANQTAEENKNKKFYSLRDKDNKSLVSMSAYFTNSPITDLEREEWIIERSTNAYKDSTYIANETKEEKEKRREEKSSQATDAYNAYLQEMQDKSGNLYAISEIKEKNNELLDFYGPLVKKLINNLFEKTGTLSDINKYVLNEIDFIKLNYRNKIISEAELKVISRYEVGYFEDLNNENYNYIEHLPENTMKKLKATILSEPNSVPLDLMNKTNWKNIKDQKIDNLNIKATDKLVLIEGSNLRVSYTGGSHIDSFSFFNKCKNLRVKINEVNNLVIKESEGIKIEFLGNKLDSTRVSPNYITMINCPGKKTKTKCTCCRQ